MIILLLHIIYAHPDARQRLKLASLGHFLCLSCLVILLLSSRSSSVFLSLLPSSLDKYSSLILTTLLVLPLCARRLSFYRLFILLLYHTHLPCVLLLTSKHSFPHCHSTLTGTSLCLLIPFSFFSSTSRHIRNAHARHVSSATHASSWAWPGHWLC